MPDAPVTVDDSIDDRAVSRLVTGRASKHLRYATFALAGTLVLVVAMLTQLQQQYGSVVDNVTANANVHYVEATFRTGQAATGTGALRFADVDRVAQVADAAAKGGTHAVGRYRIPFGLTASDGMTYFVDGLGAGGATLLARQSLPDGVAAGGSQALARAQLEVPVVQAEDGGMSSDRLETVRLDIEPLASDAPVAVFETLDPARLFVNEATFARLVAIVGDGVDWQTFRQEHDEGTNAYGFEAVAAVYVHVDDLSDVDRVGRALEQAGYSTSYTLRAFDDLAGTISGGITTGVGLMAAAFALCLVLTFTNLQSYLTLAHRDMGILRHIGYTAARVRRVYRIRLASMVVRAVTPAAVLAVAAAVVQYSGRPWLLAVDLGLVALVAGVVLAIMCLVHVPRHVNRPVLTLLKLDRQFE